MASVASCASTAHPLLLTGGLPAAAAEDLALHMQHAPPWTKDMDDMLQMLVRFHDFRWAGVSEKLREYVSRLHAIGGIFPDGVHADLYDACACRMRWSQLDQIFCVEYSR
eukprot:6199363-Pleurochrysis_carterae.AAC.2